MDQNKSIFVFNQIFLDFLKDIRKNEKLSKRISKAYKVFDKASDQYIDEFGQCFESIRKIVCELDDVSQLPLEFNIEANIVKGMQMKDIYQQCKTDADKLIMNSYLLALSIVVLLEDDEDDGRLAVVLDKLKSIEQKEDVDLSDIFDEDISKMLQAYMVVSANSTPVSSFMDKEVNGVEDFMEKMSNSKIGEIAKEISANIDTKNIKKPEDLFKGDKIGNVLKTVSETINKKMEDGSINHEELLGEAVDMVKMFSGKGMFKNVNKAALNNMAKKADTKTRLREKLASRNKSV